MVKKKIKWSPILHNIAAFSGVVGGFALFAAWIAAWGGGTFLGQTEVHLFNDAKGLFLASIAFGIGTLIHQNEEKKK